MFLFLPMSANRGPWLHALTYFPLGLNSCNVLPFHYVSDEKVIVNGIAFISVSQNMAGKNHLRVIVKNTDSGLRLHFPRGEAWESLFKKQNSPGVSFRQVWKALAFSFLPLLYPWRWHEIIWQDSYSIFPTLPHCQRNNAVFAYNPQAA